jgi:hypothetical protein
LFYIAENTELRLVTNQHIYVQVILIEMEIILKLESTVLHIILFCKLICTCELDH